MDDRQNKLTLWYLKQIPIFKEIEDSDLKKLMMSSSEMKWYKRKERVYSAHDHVDHVYIVKEGEVILYRSEDGRRVVIDVLKPGDVFGNISFSEDGGNQNFAEASQDSYVCVFSRQNFLMLFRQYPELALRMMKAMSDRMQDYEQKLYDLSSSDAKTRIVRQLRSLKEKEGKSILPKILQKSTHLTHERLGEMTGLSRETVTRALSELKDEGKVQVVGRKIELMDFIRS
jgi:CRP-like cAMP-binding protein